MGEIVAAVGTCHTPYMFTRPPDENPKQLDQAGAWRCRSWARCSTRRSRTSSSFLGADHVETFSVTCVPTFCDRRRRTARWRKFAGREHNLPIHREMAEDILNKLVVDHNFDIAYSEDAELGHAFSIPFEYVIGKRNIPVIPFFTNVYVPPLPTPRRCEALGKALARDRQGPQGARRDHRQRRHVAFPRHDQVPASRSSISIAGCVSQFEAGNARRAAEHDRHAARRGRQHGDAQLGGHVRRDRQQPKGELIDYIPTWHHGLGMMRFLPQRAQERSRR